MPGRSSRRDIGSTLFDSIGLDRFSGLLFELLLAPLLPPVLLQVLVLVCPFPHLLAGFQNAPPSSLPLPGPGCPDCRVRQEQLELDSALLALSVLAALRAWLTLPSASSSSSSHRASTFSIYFFFIFFSLFFDFLSIVTTSPFFFLAKRAIGFVVQPSALDFHIPNIS